MATLGSEILDVEIAAGQPVTSRLARRLQSNNAALVASQRLVPMFSSGYQQTDSTGWTTLYEFPIYIPDFMVGSGGTKITAEALGEGIDNTSHYRVIIGANIGDNTPAGKSNQQILIYPIITWTPSPDSYVTLELQGEVDTIYSGGYARAYWYYIHSVLMERVDS